MYCQNLQQTTPVFQQDFVHAHRAKKIHVWVLTTIPLVAGLVFVLFTRLQSSCLFLLSGVETTNNQNANNIVDSLKAALVEELLAVSNNPVIKGCVAFLSHREMAVQAACSYKENHFTMHIKLFFKNISVSYVKSV